MINFTKRTWILVGMAIPVLILALPLLTNVAVWDGRFPLTLDIETNASLDRDALQCAPCWKQLEIDYALQNPGGDEIEFSPAKWIGERKAVVEVPASGKEDVSGLVDTYIHCKFLVVEYRPALPADAPLRRKVFEIPEGRGPRSMTVRLD